MNAEFKAKKLRQFKQWCKNYWPGSKLSRDEEKLYWGFRQQAVTGEPGYSNINAFVEKNVKT